MNPHELQSITAAVTASSNLLAAVLGEMGPEMTSLKCILANAFANAEGLSLSAKVQTNTHYINYPIYPILCTYTSIHPYIHTYTQTCMHTYIHTYIHTHIHAHTHMHTICNNTH
jgi:hypothetical protein